MVEYPLDHVACNLSININEADTANTEAARRAQVYESKGLINVKYSFLSEGALLIKYMS